jgi:hypothetical protein
VPDNAIVSVIVSRKANDRRLIASMVSLLLHDRIANRVIILFPSVGHEADRVEPA